MDTIHYKFWTVCMVQDGDAVLLLDRQHDDFKGYIPPGGKVEFPESFIDAAVREVKEETGLDVHNLEYKGIYEYINVEKKDRYIIFNYLSKDFSGHLIENHKEGNPVWVKIAEANKLPMQKSIRRRFPLFFEEGTFEIQVYWDNAKNEESRVTIKKS